MQEICFKVETDAGQVFCVAFLLEPFTVSVQGLWGKTDAKLNKQMLQKRVAYMEPILSKYRTNCAEVEIDAGQMFVLPFCAKPFKVSVHGLLLGEIDAQVK